MKEKGEGVGRKSQTDTQTDRQAARQRQTETDKHTEKDKTVFTNIHM